MFVGYDDVCHMLSALMLHGNGYYTRKLNQPHRVYRSQLEFSGKRYGTNMRYKRRVYVHILQWVGFIVHSLCV